MSDTPFQLAFDHYLVFATDLQESVEWYEKVLGMERGFTPEFHVPVQWMYLGGHPIVHVVQLAEDKSMDEAYVGRVDSTQEGGSGRIDHVAFQCKGLEATLAHLDAHGVDYAERRVDLNSRYQLFFRDPNGIKIELDFDAAEVGERKPPKMLKDLIEAKKNVAAE